MLDKLIGYSFDGETLCCKCVQKVSKEQIEKAGSEPKPILEFEILESPKLFCDECFVELYMGSNDFLENEKEKNMNVKYLVTTRKIEKYSNEEKYYSIENESILEVYEETMEGYWVYANFSNDNKNKNIKIFINNNKCFEEFETFEDACRFVQLLKN